MCKIPCAQRKCGKMQKGLDSNTYYKKIPQLHHYQQLGDFLS